MGISRAASARTARTTGWDSSRQSSISQRSVPDIENRFIMTRFTTRLRQPGLRSSKIYSLVPQRRVEEITQSFGRRVGMRIAHDRRYTC